LHGASVVVSTDGSEVVVGATPSVVPSVPDGDPVVELCSGPDGVVVSDFWVVEVSMLPGVVSTETGAPGVVVSDDFPGVVVSDVVVDVGE